MLSLGGSLLSPPDTGFLKAFREVIEEREVGVVCGGGRVARDYRDAAARFTRDREVLDWVGIAATRLNAELVKSILGWKGVFAEPQKAAKAFPRVVCSGWKPGRTTDYVATLLASLVGAYVVNMTNVDFVYDKDPKKFKDAEPIKGMNWKRMIEICGSEHSPGINAPFAPAACKLAMEKGLKVVVLDGRDLENLESCLDGKEFDGTVVQ